ncbi:MAG: hypothetical protein ACOYEV_16315 [Candidatus Nanopelagicales bacterium]
MREVIEIMHQYDVSQLPVCLNTPPFASAEVSGSVDELVLMEQVVGDSALLDVPVAKVMGLKLPTIGAGKSVSSAVQLLGSAPALLVLTGGWPRAVLTRSDILARFGARNA